MWRGNKGAFLMPTSDPLIYRLIAARFWQDSCKTLTEKTWRARQRWSRGEPPNHFRLACFATLPELCSGLRQMADAWWLSQETCNQPVTQISA